MADRVAAEYLVQRLSRRNWLPHPESEHARPQLGWVGELSLPEQKAHLEGEGPTGHKINRHRRYVCKVQPRVSLLTPIRLMGTSTRRYSLFCPGLDGFG